VTQPWWEAHARLEARVECSGEVHRLEWANGVLTALDHVDPDGERALAALGGERCTCVELVDTWDRHSDDLRVLTLASRGPGDTIAPVDQLPNRTPGLVGRAVMYPAFQSTATATRAQVSASVGSWARIGSRPLQAGSAAAEDALISLSGLSTGLWDRLTATVMATWTARLSAGDERCAAASATLAAALFGRVTVAARSWLGDPNINVAVEMIDPGDHGNLERDSDGIRACLPFRWLSDIWAPGLALVLSRFSLWLIESTDERKRVMTVDSNLERQRPVSISVE
jgi:hypothetical protein